jgi:membrane dipeptidase
MTQAISRREALRPLAAMVAGAPAVLTGRFQPFGPQGPSYSARATRLVEETLTIDLLNQFQFPDFAERPTRIQRWLIQPNSLTAMDWERYRTSGLRILALGHGAGDYASGIRFIADWNAFIAGYDDWFMRVDDAADFDRVRRSGKVGILLTLQNSDHFRTPEDVDTFWGLGQRVSQLTYNYANRIGAGFLENVDGGLTVFGGEVVARMNRAGMAVDLSHCGDRTTLDGIAASTRPVIFSHASCRALVPGHLRCKTDEMIRGLARTGGVMGIPFLRFMIRDREPVTVEHVLDHFDHVARLVGVEHVGVGSDMDIVGNPNPVNGEPMRETPNWDRYQVHADTDGRITVRGLDHARRMYDLAEGLVSRRYSDADIALMLGGNWRRVLTGIWGQAGPS